MTIHLPIPFGSAHRGGNSPEDVISAIEAGADLLETDIWLHGGRLELRHNKRLGPLPILWERWSISFTWKRYTLRDLLAHTPESTLLFLDFKGTDMGLGPAILAELERYAPNRVVAICGRDYEQLKVIADAPNIITFYSVGTEAEWPIAQPYIAASAYPALSLIASMATPERIDWVTNLGGVVVCWGVNNAEEVARLHAMGVDGFTTDYPDVLKHIREVRETLEASQ